ncbi:nucleotide disphospho-sugar-binding domain-containing protein [Actinacidiphila glaucinigra]|uniref:glycosyltransferase n=1 Tax=Actinacidiphila glaucinigra TaxID=235986 RepID=UPI0033B78C29
MGTLYRRFPTKTYLVAAVVAEQVARVADDAEVVLARVDAGARAADELTAFLGRVVEAAATDRAVKAAAQALGAEPGDHAEEARALQAVLDAVADLPLHAVMATGHAVEPSAPRPPPNAEVHPYVPHAVVMPAVSLVVGHGGHGTTMQALAHDLPLVVMPMHPMLDQSMIAKAVEQQGAARVVRRNASPERIRAAISDLLASGPHRQASARLGTRLRAEPGDAAAADRIGTLAATPA